MTISLNLRVQTILLCLSLCMALSAQYSILNGSYDIRSAAMGKAGVAQRDPDNFVNNPAHLGQMQKSCAYAQWLGHYLLRELSASQLQIMLKARVPGCFGLTLQTDGGADYRESIVGLSYGRRFAKAGYIGAGMDLHTESRPESGTSMGLLPVAGIQWTIIPRVTIATSVVHPVPLQTKALSSTPPAYRFGVGYSVYEKLFVSTELQLSGFYTRDLRIGFEYRPSEKILFSTGYCGKGIISFGTGYQKKLLRIRTACQIHPDLGINTGIGMLWLFAGASG